MPILEVYCIRNGVLTLAGKKMISPPVGLPANKWIREEIAELRERKLLRTVDYPSTTSGLSIVIGKKMGKKIDSSTGYLYLGYMNSGGNNVEKGVSEVGLYSMGYQNEHGIYIIDNNFMKICALFTARKSVKNKWYNCKDEFSAPNILHKDYNQWNLDSIIYSLFNSSSNQSAMRNVCVNGNVYNIPNEFFFMDINMMKKMADDAKFSSMYSHCNDDHNRYVYNILKNSILSDDAKGVLNMAKELIKLSMDKREEYHKDNSFDNLQCWDAGWCQIEKLLSKYYKEELQDFRIIYNKFESRMRDGVYKFGFLPNETVDLTKCDGDEIL
jgi:hypothetical protein